MAAQAVQAALPLPPFEPSEDELRAVFETTQLHLCVTFERAMENTAVRACLRNLAEARARAKANVKGRRCRR
jgi:hypothetical protein